MKAIWFAQQRLALATVGFFTLGVAPLHAQGDAALSISGTVFDSTGAGVEAATVTVYALSTAEEHTARTAQDGRFKLPPLSSGQYRVTAAATNMVSSTATVLYAGLPLLLELRLVPKGGTSQVTVTADPQALDDTAPARVTISREEIRRLPSQSISSPLSSLITSTTPGIAADSNGSFHPLGDHAEASFVIDGQPITDQQSRTFSSQIALTALQSLQVLEGAPQADVGDKTSMVIVGETRSGLDQFHPTGELSFALGSFRTRQASGHIAAGTARAGSFTAVEVLRSGRFLDTPELEPLHANGSLGNAFQRFDWKAGPQTTLHFNLSGSRASFQTPNTYDQQAARQNQRQTMSSFNVAPSVLHTFGAASFLQSNLWVRQDTVRYRPSADPFADTPATLAQSRRLTNAGSRTTYHHARGRHTAMLGAEWRHTFLAESFSTGLTDPAYNSPCLAADGAPAPDTAFSAVTQCAGAGLATNPAFLPSLVAIDLSRQGRLFSFRGYTDIKQEALFGQDAVRLGAVTAIVGLRFEAYNGITASKALQPRLGLAYSPAALHTVFRGAYSRVLITPYNENLIVASSAGPGSTAAGLGATDSAPLRTGYRNQFNLGFETQLRKHVTISGEYFWKFTYGAYDFDVLLNSPLTFPTQFRKSKIDGGLLHVTLLPVHGFAGYVTASRSRSRLFGPETGGVSFSAPYNDVVRPDHDQGLAASGHVRYQHRQRGPWVGLSWRYDGGLVSVSTPDFGTVLRLTGNEQAQLGLQCAGVSAAVAAPIRSCAQASLVARRITIPPAGTWDADRNPSRIVPRHVVDLAFGQDALLRHERQVVGFHMDLVNLTNNDGLYNFLSTFSGTHFLAPRTVTAELRYSF